MISRTRRSVAFITGIAGFAGSHLAELLVSEGYRVCGALHPEEKTNNLKNIKSDIELVKLDIRNSSKCSELIRKIKPDYLFHLAALASVWRSFEMDRQVYKVNLNGTLNLLQAVLELRKISKFVFASSSDCYGHFNPKSITLTEEQPLNPVSPYALSKVMAEQACRYYHVRHGLPVTISRAFAHCGPRQSPDFVVSAFARQIAQIEAGEQSPKMKVGNLTPRRDMSDVRDIVRGYFNLAQKGKAGRVYQLCSGKAVAIQSILNMLLGLSNKKIKIVTDPKRMRKVDIPLQRGNNRRAVQEIGYKCRYTLKTTLRDTLNFWREQTGRVG